MKKCPMCTQYVKLSDWPTYKGKFYTYCRKCKRLTQAEWVRVKREMKEN